MAPKNLNATSEKNEGLERFLPLCFLWSGLLGVVLLTWQTLVNSNVPEPYLDEAFHIPQAQRYCANDLTWDPFITTPPGIYLFSRFAHLQGVPCSPAALRGINAVLTLLLIFPSSFLVRASSNSFALDELSVPGNAKLRAVLKRQRLATDLHAAVNVCLFPPLFMFTSLYYTDVGSTGVVLLFIALLDGRASFVGDAGKDVVLASCTLVGTWLALQGRLSACVATALVALLLRWFVSTSSGPYTRPCSMCLEKSTSIWLLFLFGLLALLFRQTNVFWVALYPVGLRMLSHSPRRSREEGKGFLGFVPERFELWPAIFNPTVDEADIFDYVRTALTTVNALAFNVTLGLHCPQELIRPLSKIVLPFAPLAGCFAAFVAWNGGVVLGHKSYHVATIHVPQMLYLWPYITFFSLPLMYPYILTGTAALVGRLCMSSVRLPAYLQLYYTSLPLRMTWHLAVALLLLGSALSAIRFNTIVHPFTLADNRHYVFYVFRVVILRNSTAKYLAVPVYMACAWLSIQALGTPAKQTHLADKTPKAKRKMSDDQPKVADINYGKVIAEAIERIDEDARKIKLSHPAADQVETRTGFVLTWLATTTLCVITAPLVEPRYHILTWILWRLHLPSPSLMEEIGRSPTESQNAKAKDLVENWESVHLLSQIDHRLWLETAWFLLINAVTGYLFLYRGFEWPQEPGKVQRFIW